MPLDGVAQNPVPLEFTVLFLEVVRSFAYSNGGHEESVKFGY